MLKHRFYYTLKPFLPWRVRMAARRISARRILTRSKNIWPIYPTAATPPAGWSGWPEGHRFAVVLTHDVEGPVGLAKCRRLAEIEQRLGFRSCFNFIPDGPYRVPADLRRELVADGFETGVHDLRHDGTLFRSERGFHTDAVKINQHLHEWNAVGFRSGFMLRNLDWLHALDIHYDCSTFDTDPFELQPDGTRTIFPFWVERPARKRGPGTGDQGPGTKDQGPRTRHDAPNAEGAEGSGQSGRVLHSLTPSSLTPSLATPPDRSGRGYVELPYTLPQDSTLFLLLGETSPDVWLRKVNWIAANGGMVLVNVHPDYIRFEGDRPSARTYDVRHYVRFLEYLRDRYAGEYWQPLPRSVAQLVWQLSPRPRVHLPRRICMVTHSSYECDNRVTRYAESLAARGDQVDVFALRSAPTLPRQEVLNGVSVHRIHDRFGKAQRSPFAYIWPLVRFFFNASRHVTRRHSWNRYDVVHVHNMPDFLVFAAWYPKLTGARVLLDIHDLVPEFYTNKFASARNGTASALLKWTERRSARFADHVIVSNHLWRDTFAARTGTEDRCSVFINNVDTQTFRPSLRTRRDDRIIVLFPGGLQWHQGVDIALQAFVKVSRTLPKAEFHIYGDGIMKPSLVALASDLGFNGNVKFFEPVRISQIASIMANADLGVVPKRADSFGNEAYSTKIMEFMSLGVPVVVSSTAIDRYYFDDSLVRFFESGNSDALADAMIDLLRDQDLRRNLTQNALGYSRRNSWDSRKRDYLALVDSLIARQSGTCDFGNAKPR